MGRQTLPPHLIEIRSNRSVDKSTQIKRREKISEGVLRAQLIERINVSTSRSPQPINTLIFSQTNAWSRSHENAHDVRDAKVEGSHSVPLVPNSENIAGW